MLPLEFSAIESISTADPQWLRDRKHEAFAIFQGLALPSEKDEVWKYVTLDLDLDSFCIPTSGSPIAETSAGPSEAEVVDGRVIAAGGIVRNLARAVAEDPNRIKAMYGTAIPVSHDLFTAAHHAFVGDAVVVPVPRGIALTETVGIAVRAQTERGISFPHVLVDVADGAEASIVIHYSSPQGLSALAVPHLEVAIGNNANLTLTIVQNWGYSTTSLSQGRITVGRDSSVTVAQAGLGGSLARLHLTIDLEGRGSSARVLGAYFGEKEQVLDYRYFMRHIGENTRSEMFLKGAVEDRALSIFTGMIRIEESAQRTDAFQANRNLILSDGAAAQSVPNLEILADDVRCGHGSTVGPLDSGQRYYLMSRGLARERADRLQVRGFFEEVLSRFPSASVASPIRDRINEKYIEAQDEGRV